jgi:hypothetical protein
MFKISMKRRLSGAGRYELMARFARLLALFLILAVLLTGCSAKLPRLLRFDFSKPEPETPPPAATEAPPPPPLPELVPAASLLPAADWRITFSVRDLGQPPVEVEEDLLLDGGRLVGLYNGMPYVTWLLREDGLWRLDPKGGGALLRYLPPILQDGEAWRQRSGSAEVWFRLRRLEPECTGWPWPGQPEQCWELTVLNRGEKIVFTLVSGIGPVHVNAQNWETPRESFIKAITDHRASPLTEARRTEVLGHVKPLEAEPGAVIPVSPAEFDAATVHMMNAYGPKLPVQKLDINGDGREETVRGQLNAWNALPVQFFAADGVTLLGSFEPQPQHRMRAIRLPGHPGHLLLYENGNPEERFDVTLLYLGAAGVEMTQGWDVRVRGTAANRVTVTDDGRIVVEWEMQDPARHRRIRTYRFQGGERPAVVLESTVFVPAAGELVRPATHEELLLAAFVARWYNLLDELPRYFTTPEAATAFGADIRITEPNYRPGEVKLGRVNPVATQAGTCLPAVENAPIGADGTVGFAAGWGGFEWCASLWGQVTFGRDGEGRLLIQQLRIEGHVLRGL